MYILSIIYKLGFYKEEEVKGYIKESKVALLLQLVQAININIANPK